MDEIDNGFIYPFFGQKSIEEVHLSDQMKQEMTLVDFKKCDLPEGRHGVEQTEDK